MREFSEPAPLGGAAPTSEPTCSRHMPALMRFICPEAGVSVTDFLFSAFRRLFRCISSLSGRLNSYALTAESPRSDKFGKFLVLSGPQLISRTRPPDIFDEITVFIGSLAHLPDPVTRYIRRNSHFYRVLGSPPGPGHPIYSTKSPFLSGPWLFSWVLQPDIFDEITVFIGSSALLPDPVTRYI